MSHHSARYSAESELTNNVLRWAVPSLCLTPELTMKTEAEKKPVVIHLDKQARRWISLKDASRLVGIPDKTLYCAIYRAGEGRKRTLQHRYIKETSRQFKGTCFVLEQEVIDYKAEEIVKDADRVESQLNAVLQQYGISREEADAIANTYKRAFEKVIGDVRAKELEGVIASEQPIIA
jgi:hypothetical protein